MALIASLLTCLLAGGTSPAGAQEDEALFSVSFRIGAVMQKMRVPPSKGVVQAWQYPLEECVSYDLDCFREISIYVHREIRSAEPIEIFVTLVDHAKTKELRVEERPPHKGYWSIVMLAEEDSVPIETKWKRVPPKQTAEPLRFAVTIKPRRPPKGVSEPFVFCTRRPLAPFHPCEF